MYDKIIFLDIDGVCTSMVETPGSYINHGPDEYGLSPKCMMNLKRLIKETGCNVIISSNWRLNADKEFVDYNGSKIRNPLFELRKELEQSIIGMLPKTGFKQKAEALIQWFDENSFDGQFVILDDDPEEGLDKIELYSISSHLIFTDYKYGLRKKDCNKIKAIFTEKENAAL